jgi:YidC/Oxa1 family membrane protein insertase
MERRFTSLLLPVLIATMLYLLFFADTGADNKKPLGVVDPLLNEPAVQAVIKAQEQHEFDAKVPSVTHTFGEKDGKGYQITWSRYGAGVQAIALNDDYVDSAARAKTEKSASDYYPLVPYYSDRPVRDWGYGLVLEGRGADRFPKAIDDGGKYQLWELAGQTADEVRFSLDMGNGLSLEKVFSYEAGCRDLLVDIELKNKAAKDVPASYQIALRGVQVWNPASEHLLGNPASAYVGARNPEGDEVAKVLAAADATAVLWSKQEGGSFQFAGTTNRFFGAFLIPATAATAEALNAVETRHWPSSGFLQGGEDIAAGSVPEVLCNMNLVVPQSGKTTRLSFRLFLGPKSSATFAEQPEYQPLSLVMDNDLTPPCCCIPGISGLAKALVWLLTALHGMVNNWGVAIIMLTLVVRIILSPINFNMQRTMRLHGEKMAKVKPQLDALNKRYKDDPKQLQAEMMKFNKEHKLLSAPLKGCLPMFLTMPIWFGLFTALRVMYELRGAPFVGYIQDLSRPDMLFELGIPLIPHFNLLPIIMVALWLYLQMGTPLPKDPQQRQMMVMMRFMPIMMGVMLYGYASGLMIYMCTSSLWGIVEQKVTKKILGPVNPDATGGMPSMPMV